MLLRFVLIEFESDFNEVKLAFTKFLIVTSLCLFFYLLVFFVTPLYIVLQTTFFSKLDDMPPGQTPHTIMLYAHNDLVDAVQPGDR